MSTTVTPKRAPRGMPLRARATPTGTGTVTVKPDVSGTLAGRRIGFVGLGDIGLPMVANLLRAGAQVWVHDLRPAAVRKAVKLGAQAATLAEMAAGCQFVSIAVINEKQLRQVLFGKDGLLDPERAVPARRLTVLVHSTVPPRVLQELEPQLAERKVKLLDAPMSGANIAAKAGTLAFLVGGRAPVLKACKPLLDAMGSRIFHLGPVGNGQVGKLVNGLIFHVSHVVILEALRLADAYGVPETDIIPLVRASTGNNWTIQNWGYFDRFLGEHTLAGTDALVEGLLRKDIGDALIAGRDAKSSLPMSGLAMELYPQLIYERQRRLKIGGKGR